MKPAILFLHGALGSKKQFNAIIQSIDQTHEVHALNFSGHGGQAIQKAFSMDLFMQDVNDYVKKHQLKDIHLMGYSMGGYVALKLAAQKADYIKQITTIGTKFNWSEDAAEKEIQLLNPEKMEEKIPQFVDSLKKEHAGEDWKQVVRETAKLMKNLALKEKLSKNDLKNIQTPITIARGDQDQMVSQAESEWAVKHLPQATYKVLENCPHPLPKIPITQFIKLIDE